MNCGMYIISLASVCSLIVANAVDPEPDINAEDDRFERASEVDIRNGSTFINLDSYIYDALCDPTKGTGPALLDKLELLTHCMRSARTMFLEGNEDADYGVRAAALIFFNYGGPKLNRIPLYNEENTTPIKREYGWTDDDIKHLEQWQLKAEHAWSSLRKSIL